ncbi:MAG: hypothetical protein KatS3mg077_3002 [Candidatus Binatia bacterium]|nr:MAG: hypothetical protein KatS3mg077_3002 [Candidatus Binatia bacterium]
MSKRHVPVRLCVGCGQRDRKQALIRVSVASGGILILQPDSIGRGAYLHRNVACWQAFASRKGTVRSLRLAVDRAAREALVQSLVRTAK